MFLSSETPDQGVFDAEAVLNCLMEESSDCISVKDRYGRYQWINAAGCAFLGFEADEVIGKTDYELFSRETATSIIKSDREVMQSGKTKTFEAFLKSVNGQNNYFQAVKCPMKNHLKEVIGIINVVRQVPEPTITPQWTPA